MTRQKWAVVVVTSDSRGLRFKSSRRQTVLKDENKEKDAVMAQC